MAQRHRVVIVGGGFGGINAAKALAKANVDVTIVDRTNHHLFQPLLYQVAAGILPEGLIAPAIRSVVGDQRNCQVALAEVQDIDVENRVVIAREPDTGELRLPYDTLVLAAGATHSYFGNEEKFAQYAPGMKTIEDARYLRDGILAKYEMAELETDPAEKKRWLTFAIIGAGPTGVELAGQIAELAHVVLPRDYRHIDTTSTRILLLEGAPAVLPPFDEKLQKWTHDKLTKMGVEIRTNTLAVDMDRSSITVKGPDGSEEIIPCRTRIWAAGVQGSPLARVLAGKLGIDVDRAGRIPVGPDCSVNGRSDIYAVGDIMTLDKLPGVAQVAMQQGKYVGKLVTGRLAGQPAPPPFKYFDKGSMATIGYKAAVAESFGMKMTGVIGFLAWGFIHIMYLVGWGNRFGALYSWLRAMVFSKNRGHRIITFDGAENVAHRGVGGPISKQRLGDNVPVPDAPTELSGMRVSTPDDAS
ncbi:NAD(P)/FAD-dependent oxidoreductase [Ammonicoccus fulvus]|uniref:NADH:ubiquinone reductase (non-electrogenic) n=1 Tax=Ammonicoccus fulvus TaxID=3138240 RepID=A0ABZ3FS97_9ACTN